MNRQLCEKEIQMASKHIERCSFSPVIESYIAKQNRDILFIYHIDKN